MEEYRKSLIYVLSVNSVLMLEPLGYFLDAGTAQEALEWIRERDPESTYEIVEIKPYLLADTFIRDYSDEVHGLLAGAAL